MTALDVMQKKIDTWNSQDRDGYLALFGDDFEFVTPDMSASGRKAAADFYDWSHRTYPDSTVKAEAMYETGDTVVVEWLLDGTNTGPISLPDGSEIPATGRRVSLTAAGIYTTRGDMIIRTRYYWDNASVMAQLGLV